jgi:hypothetical protein
MGSFPQYKEKPGVEYGQDEQRHVNINNYSVRVTMPNAAGKYFVKYRLRGVVIMQEDDDAKND